MSVGVGERVGSRVESVADSGSDGVGPTAGLDPPQAARRTTRAAIAARIAGSFILATKR